MPRKSSRGGPTRQAPHNTIVVFFLLHDRLPTTAELEPGTDPGDLFDAFHITGSPALLEAAWRQHRAALLEAWIAARPGSRPSGWWLFDAPEPRRLRTGGTGVEASVRWAPVYQPWVRCGVELMWASVSKTDPPRHESEAAYLERHALWIRGEKVRVPDGAWADEVLLAEGLEDDDETEDLTNG